MKRPEEQLQRTIADFMRRCVPAPPVGPVWTFVNNGMKRTKAEAGIAKAMGQRAGWPDITMCWQGRLVGIEIKAPGTPAKPSDTQEPVHIEIAQCGGVATTCNSLEGFVGFLDALGVPINGKVAA